MIRPDRVRTGTVSPKMLLIACALALVPSALAFADEWSNRPVAELVVLARAEDRATRNNAIVALGKIGGPEAERALLAALDDNEWSNRWRAAEGLGKIAGPAAVTRLIAQLTMEVGWEEEQAAGRTPPRYPDYLRGYVKVPEFQQRAVAIAIRNILTRNRGLQSIPVMDNLAKTMKDPTQKMRIRAELALILGEIGDRRSVPTLIEVLGHEPSGALRAWSARTLGDLGAREAIPALKAALQDPSVTPDTKHIPAVRLDAKWALQKLQQRQPSPRQD